MHLSVGTVFGMAPRSVELAGRVTTGQTELAPDSLVRCAEARQAKGRCDKIPRVTAIVPGPPQ